MNLYPEPGYQSSKTQMALIGRPGLSPAFATLGHSPARGIWAGNNTMYAAGGTHFYSIPTGGGSGGALTDYGAMAGSAGIGPVQIIANGVQLLVMDSSSQTIYNALASGPTMNAVFNGPALEYLDDFYVAIASGASLAGANPNQINVSANGDGTSWPALDYVIRTGAADLTTQLATLNSLLWIFGSKTTEIWYDAGNAIFPFQRVSGGTLNIGLLAPYSVVKFFNTILWIGSDATGCAQVYMANGMTPVRVSNYAIENILTTPGLANVPQTYAYGYQEAGHTFYCIKLCNSSFVPYAELVYDLTTGLWHERSYAGIWPCSFANQPGNFYQAWNGANGPFYVGDANSANIYLQTIGRASDNGAAINYYRTAPHLSNSNKVIRYPRFELDIDPQATSPGGTGSIQPVLDYSNDGGKNFLGYNRAMQQASDQGFPTGFQRFFALQLGRSRDRVFKVSITDASNLIRIPGAYLTGVPGMEQ